MNIVIDRTGVRIYVGSSYITLTRGGGLSVRIMRFHAKLDVWVSSPVMARDAAAGVSPEPFLQAHYVGDPDALYQQGAVAVAAAAQTMTLPQAGVPDYNPFLVEQEFVSAVESSYESYERAVDVMLDAGDAYKAGSGSYEAYEAARDAVDDARTEYEHSLKLADARMTGRWD